MMLSPSGAAYVPHSADAAFGISGFALGLQFEHGAAFVPLDVSAKASHSRNRRHVLHQHPAQQSSNSGEAGGVSSGASAGGGVPNTSAARASAIPAAKPCTRA
jgi:hypothetical protein